MDRAVRYKRKIGQMGTKWDKSEDKIYVYFARLAKNVLKSDFEQSQLCPIWCQSDPLWSKSDMII